jgi:hypothetical protein
VTLKIIANIIYKNTIKTSNNAVTLIIIAGNEL